jgi:hypothetical protein
VNLIAGALCVVFMIVSARHHNLPSAVLAEVVAALNFACVVFARDPR